MEATSPEDLDRIDQLLDRNLRRTEAALAKGGTEQFLIAKRSRRATLLEVREWVRVLADG